MLSFSSDYMQGCVPKILKRLESINSEAFPGYGSDQLTTNAIQKIRVACQCPEADVYFLVGGTQTNRVVISTGLKPYEGVIAVTTGHVSLHEAGAIENSGHKVIELAGVDAKLRAVDLRRYLENFYADENHEHMVKPGMVYISFPTEYGTLYSKAELTELYCVCKEYKMPLYIDGARLGYGLTSEVCDMTLPELARLCDVFYIGGTKVGALFGEAIVYPKGNAPEHFMSMIKQEGALLAKGWLSGAIFETLFTDDLYWKISEHANLCAKKIREAFARMGLKPYIESYTNQQFFAFEKPLLEQLSKSVNYGFWENLPDGKTVVRFATSWATKLEDVDRLIETMRKLLKK